MEQKIEINPVHHSRGILAGLAASLISSPFMGALIVFGNSILHDENYLPFWAILIIADLLSLTITLAILSFFPNFKIMGNDKQYYIGFVISSLIATAVIFLAFLLILAGLAFRGSMSLL